MSTAQQAVREPELADDLAARQIAVEALLAGRAEGAVEHTARLARNAQRAAVCLGNEHRFDGIRLIDLEQPFARAVFGGGIGHDHRRIDARADHEALAQRLRKIAHAGELALAALVDPVQQLARTERLLALLGEIALERRSVEADQVHLEYTSHAGKKYPTSTRAVSLLSEPCTALASMESAKSARMVPCAAFFGSVAPISSRFLAMAFSPSSTCTSTGPEVMNSTRSRKNGRCRCTA